MILALRRGIKEQDERQQAAQRLWGTLNSVRTPPLRYTDQRKKGTMAYIIAEPCIGTKDTACVDVCPVDCIHPAKGRTYDDGRPTFDEVPQLYIDPTECIDCGACVPVCPVTAIFPLDDLPEKSHAYIQINKNYVDGGKFQPDKYEKASS
jgi:ferredoxin